MFKRIGRSPFAIFMVGILVICLLEIIALCHGVNGVALTASFTAIGAMGGWTAKSLRNKKEKSNK